MPLKNKQSPTPIYFDRELSWLMFNRRVLEESLNLRHPIAERLRFLAISDNNLDEFLMVRVAGIINRIKMGVDDINAHGLDSKQQFRQVMEEVKNLVDRQKNYLKHVMQDAKKNHIEIINHQHCTQKDKEYLKKIFLERIFTSLTPLTLDPMHPFPFIPNKAITLMFEMKHKKDQTQMMALLIVPSKLKRFIKLDWHQRKHVFITIEDLIIMFANHIFKGFDIINQGILRIIRDSNIEYYEESEDLVKDFANSLKKRRLGRIIHVRHCGHISHDFIDLLHDEIDIETNDYISNDMMIALNDLQQIITEIPQKYRYHSITPRWPQRLEYFNNDCFEAIKRKDFIVHHPYEDFAVVVRFLRQAAFDNNVIAIKQTLYRTSNDSPIVEALIAAAENGKTVTALVELKARFDEEANLRWANDLEKAGVQVVYGFAKLKTHAKASLVIRRENNQMRTYMHFGTGNYHPITAKFYSDISLFTCYEPFAHDATALFNYMTGYAEPETLQDIIASPINLRQKLVAHIHHEIDNAKNNLPAWIIIKANNLVDKAMIDELYAASQAGVKVDIIIRSICCLIPQRKGLSENIRVRALVGRFLEHSRLYAFANGHHFAHEDKDFCHETIVYISSADMMPRNLDRRIENAIPIHNRTVKQQLLQEILQANLRDEANCWELTSDGDFLRHPNALKKDAFCSQHYFVNNPSLSGMGKSLPRKKSKSKIKDMKKII